MRLNRYIDEAKYMEKIMIGFDFSNNMFKKITNQIGDILKENSIQYEEIKDKHISVVQIIGKYPKDDIIREINSVRKIKFNPKELSKIYGPFVKKDFIVIEYKTHDEYIHIFKDIADKYDIRLFIGGPRPHISLMKTEPKLIPDKLFNFIKENVDSVLPRILPSSISLFNKEARIDYTKKL